MEFSIKGLDTDTLVKLFDNLVKEIELLRKAIENMAVEMVVQNETL